ncbi:MAG: PEP-CTERM sorting domain-containing protein [Planctomycetota bacterium]|nr:PEP-CTERM sorting domain-containing protein [Planctomycetota bacterium]
MTRMIGWAVVVSVVSILASSVAWAAYTQSDDLLPSPQYKEKGEEEIMYANGIVLKHLKLSNLDGRVSMATGMDYNVNSFFDVFLELDLGLGAHGYQAPHQQASVRFAGTGMVGSFDAEILSMDIAGGGLPMGVQIRESPTKASIGRTTCTPLGGGGGYMIDSFFDIFTEVSLDGGQTWSLSAQSARIDGLPEPATLCLLGAGAAGLLARWRRK